MSKLSISREDRGGSRKKPADINGCRTAEEMLKLFQVSVERSSEAIMWHDVNREKVIYANKAACDRLGYTKEELLSMSVPDIDPDVTYEFLDQLKDKLRREGSFILESRHKTKDGRIFPVEVRGVYIPWCGQEFVVTIDLDISERKELEKARDQAELYLDLMGHDINNFNQIALGYLELADDAIKSGGRIGEEQAELIEKPMASLKNSSRLIGNMRKLQKIKTGHIKLRIINLCDVLERAKERYSRIAGREVTINYTPAGACMVMANELIDEVFANLIDNSLKHSQPGRPLCINIIQSRVYRNGKEYFRVSVEDNGPGIPDEIKRKLLTRSMRGQTRAEGKGLGLYIVKTLVEDFNGRVWVEDRVPGDYTKGAKFVVSLPAV